MLNSNYGSRMSLHSHVSIKVANSPTMRPENVDDIHTLRNKDAQLLKTHSSLEDNDVLDDNFFKCDSPSIDKIGCASLSRERNSFVVIEKTPFKFTQGQVTQGPLYSKRLSNIKSAESLKLELNLQQMKDLAGTAANRNAKAEDSKASGQAFQKDLERSLEKQKIGADKLQTKGIFNKHVEIDDEKMRERDKEAFKRNNPLAFKQITSQNLAI
jgi:hypothetical protein